MNFILKSAILGMTGVALGAMGAHSLKEILSPEMLSSFQTATRYQLFHAICILSVGIWNSFHPSKYLQWAIMLFFIGTLLFSGSIYLLTTLQPGIKLLGILTPIGGTVLIIGWLFLVIEGIKSKL